MRNTLRAALGAGLVLCLAGCASAPPRHRAKGYIPGADLLLRYAFNHDGKITRAELERGLRQDFARDDTNHDGRLDKDEVRAVNERRWAADASTTSPLVDWNHDGYVDFDEFAAAPRSLFDQLDENGDGVVTTQELRPFVRSRAHGRPQPGEIPGLPGGDEGGGDSDSN